MDERIHPLNQPHLRSSVSICGSVTPSVDYTDTVETTLEPIPPPVVPAPLMRQLAQRLIELTGRRARVLLLGANQRALAAALRDGGLAVVQAVARAQALPLEAGIIVWDAAAQLPFARERFDAVLVNDWWTAAPGFVAELRRVVCPHRPVLVGTTWRDPALIDVVIHRAWQRHAGIAVAPAVFVAEALAAGGAAVDERVLLEWEDAASAAIELDRIAARRYDSAAALDEARLQTSVEQMNQWVWAAHLDANAVTLALRQFRLVTARWNVGA